MPQPAYQPAQMMPAQTNLDIARTALYEGNLDVAKQAYQAELTRTNDPDLHGELGNVYFAQQNWQDAAIEYAAAVEGLSAQGRFLQAQYVLGFLMQINPDMGQKAMMNLRATMYPQNN
jgi:tetratricopeptide (TPR) repeat protein